MNKIVPIILLILVVAALSGCTGSKETVPTASQKYVRTNLNLDGKIVNVKFDRDYVIAGEKVAAELIVANTGSEKITNETVEIKAKVTSLEDFLANLYLKTMSDEKKTRTFTMEFDTEIEPNMVKPISAIFHTQQEMQGRSLAGTYEVTINLFVNGQYADTKVLPITLHSGTPQEYTPTPAPTPSPTPTPTPTPTPIITETPTPTPTPTPMPELFGPIVNVTSTGKKIAVSISSNKFELRNASLKLGDQLIWNNFDSTIYTIVNSDGIIGNITVAKEGKAYYIFNRTGIYHFDLYDKLKIMPSKLTVNVSQ
jgi:hypothetical protein